MIEPVSQPLAPLRRVLFETATVEELERVDVGHEVCAV